MILRFQQGGCDLSQLSDAAGVSVQVASASPVITSIALDLPEDGDAEAVKAEMRNQGWYFVDQSRDCPLLVSGTTGGLYRVTVGNSELELSEIGD